MIDRMLLAKEMRVTVFDEHINEDDLLSAMTPTSASVEKDYERLELLGAFSLHSHNYLETDRVY